MAKTKDEKEKDYIERNYVFGLSTCKRTADYFEEVRKTCCVIYNENIVRREAWYEEREAIKKENGEPIGSFDWYGIVKEKRSSNEHWRRVNSTLINASCCRRLKHGYEKYFRDLAEAKKANVECLTSKPKIKKLAQFKSFKFFTSKSPRFLEVSASGVIHCFDSAVARDSLCGEPRDIKLWVVLKNPETNEKYAARVYVHRPLPLGHDIRAASLVRIHEGKWEICLSVRVPKDTLEKSCGAGKCGIDLGSKTFASFDNGDKMDALKPMRQAEQRIRQANRALARCKDGSNRRQKRRQELGRLHRKVRNQRKAFHYAAAKEIVDNHDFIAVEALNVAEMMKRKQSQKKKKKHGEKKKAPRIKSKFVADAAWGLFRQRLKSTAVRRGANVVEVDPHGTTQQCSCCGKWQPKKLTLKDRVYKCFYCGLEIDRDTNAAINILERAVLDDDSNRPVQSRLGAKQEEPLAVTSVSPGTNTKRSEASATVAP